MAMIYVTDIAAKKLKEAAKRQKRTPGMTLEIMLESEEKQHRVSDSSHTENKLFSASNK